MIRSSLCDITLGVIGLVAFSKEKKFPAFHKRYLKGRFFGSKLGYEGCLTTRVLCVRHLYVGFPAEYHIFLKALRHKLIHSRKTISNANNLRMQTNHTSRPPES